MLNNPDELLNKQLEALLFKEGAPHVEQARRGLYHLMEALLEARLQLEDGEGGRELPDEVHQVGELYQEVLDRWVLPKLDRYSQLPSFELFQPRTFLVDMESVARASEKNLDWLFTPGRSPGLRLPSAHTIREDSREMFRRHNEQEALAVWVAALPEPLQVLVPGRYLAFFHIMDKEGREACLVATHEHVVWLPLTGTEMTEVLDTVTVLGASHGMADINRELTKGLTMATVKALSSSATLASPLLDPEKANAVAQRLWVEDTSLNQVLDMALAEFSYDGVSGQDELMGSLTRAALSFMKRLKQYRAEAEAQTEKTAKRLRKDQERMQMAYDGLKARAARQDVTIRQLQTELRQLRTAGGPPIAAGAGKAGSAPAGAAASTQPNLENESFDAGLNRLFGVGA